jgi:hypothetical protein
VPDALEAARKDMQEKAAEEFDAVQRHRPLSIVPFVILPTKRDLPLRQGQQPAIGQRDTMRVAGEVLEDLVGAR